MTQSVPASLFLFSGVANPDPEFPNPYGWLGASVNGYVSSHSWEAAESVYLHALQSHGWIPEAAAAERKIVTPHNLPWDVLEFFDRAVQEGVALQVIARDEDGEHRTSETLPDGAVVTDELTLAMLRCCRTAIRIGGNQLDFSEESLNVVDELIPRLDQQRADSYALQHNFAGYVGEVVRRNLGGSWDNNPTLGNIVISENFHASPLEWVKARFQDFDKASIAYHFDALKHRLALIQSVEAGEPAPLPDEHRAKLLCQAPLIVFLLVAGADGKIGENVNLKFKKIVEAATNHPNRLFGRSIQAMQRDFLAHSKELLELGQMAWMAMLPSVRQEAEAALPDQAAGYVQALSQLGEQIAKSDGGFLGFGGISKQEKAALNLVRRLLGVAS